MMLNAQACRYISPDSDLFPNQTFEILASTSINTYEGEDAYEFK